MTVLELIQRSTEYLARQGIDSARLQAELLLAHVLRQERMQLYLNFDRVLTSSEVDAYREFIRRRASREPLQHIVGSTSFCGLEMTVSRDVLVPRPETELLAEMGWEFLRTLVRSRHSQSATVLDWGTGSGCIAIAIAVNCPEAKVTAIDYSAEALAVAAANASTNGVSERVSLLPGEGLSALPPGAMFDLIISNPPYIPTREIDELDPEVRDYDPRSALDGGADGMVCITRLLCEAGAFLAPEGKLMLELGDGQADPAKQLARNQNWIVEAIREDYTHRPRILIAKKEHGQSID